jgi:hypothetical protein
MDRQALPQVERLIIESKKRIARQRDVVAAAFQEGHDSSLIGRKSKSEDDHGRPRPVPNCCRSATDVKRRSAKLRLTAQT